MSGGQRMSRERPDRGETGKGGHPVNGHPVERVRRGWQVKPHLPRRRFARKRAPTAVDRAHRGRADLWRMRECVVEELKQEGN